MIFFSSKYHGILILVLPRIIATPSKKGCAMKEKILIQKGDITEMKVDAIVNAANTDLILGAGVAGAIRRKGGPTIQKECNEHGPVALGEAAITGAGNLPACYVIHAASMGRESLTTEKSLADSTRNSLLRAEEKSLKSIAFPAIGTGVAGFPVDRCAEIMLRETIGFLKKTRSLEKVYFVLFDDRTYNIFKSAHEKLEG
jgi:O-acetyl-ADP-ribose deacetylase (regulator of RNase III)